MLVIPGLVLLFSRIHRTYDRIGALLELGQTPKPPARKKSLVVVPVSSISRLTAAGISTALSIGDDVTAVKVSFTDPEDEAADEAFRRRWEEWHPNVPLVTLRTAHRSITQPIVKYLARLEAEERYHQLVVLIPEVQPPRFWDYLLFNQRGAILERAIRRGTANVVLCRLRYRLEHFTPGPGRRTQPSRRRRTAAPTVAAAPTAATTARHAYWMVVAKIWSGTPSSPPSARSTTVAAAVSAHRPVSSAQHGPAISTPIRMRCGPLAASQAAITALRMRLSRHSRPTLHPGSRDSSRRRPSGQTSSRTPAAAMTAAGSRAVTGRTPPWVTATSRAATNARYPAMIAAPASAAQAAATVGEREREHGHPRVPRGHQRALAGVRAEPGHASPG